MTKGKGNMEEEPRKRRRIIVDDDEDDAPIDRGSDADSNPDEQLSQPASDDEEGEDLQEHWIE